MFKLHIRTWLQFNLAHTSTKSHEHHFTIETALLQEYGSFKSEHSDSEQSVALEWWPLSAERWIYVHICIRCKSVQNSHMPKIELRFSSKRLSQLWQTAITFMYGVNLSRKMIAFHVVLLLTIMLQCLCISVFLECFSYWSC